MKEETKEKQLFDMVYQWGRVGLVTDEKCQAFQDLINEIQREKISLQKKEILEKILDDLWEKAQTDERGFGKAYSYLAGEYLKKQLT